MKPDPITNSIASMGLLNGSIRIVPSSSQKELGRPLFSCAGQFGYVRDGRIGAREGVPAEQMTVLEYLAKCRFGDVVAAVASTLGDMSLKGPDAYAAVLDTVRQAGTSAMAVLEPADAAWPDAAVAVLPYLQEPGALAARPYARVFQCQCALYLAAEDGAGMSAEDVYEACAADTGLMLAEAPIADGSVRYTGWSTAANNTVSFWSVPVDLSRPWTVVKGPSGEMLDTNVRPMRLAAAGLNYYDGSGAGNGDWCVVASGISAKPAVTPFRDQDGARAFLMERFLAANDAAGDKIVPEASYADGDGMCAVLSVKTDAGTAWLRWDVVRIGGQA